ncbi:hypothetical protein KSP40_PGU011057 [Platanthera guangdongensis]|uniref:Alpha/beta hydrolase fold-3 domain-containing protein n=1 Tax=Platanthera guangdongensis TaxID=2320717 RepID=A0ABR2LNB7_9ASPA
MLQRYIPSEFGFDVEHLDIMEPAKSTLSVKARIRQRIREEGVPHTIVCGKIAANWHFLPRIGQVEGFGPPTDKIHILGDGNTKAVFVREEDTATYTVKAADDPRTLNKIMYLRPPGCVISHNELIDLWEKKTCKKLERIYIPEHEEDHQIGDEFSGGESLEAGNAGGSAEEDERCSCDTARRYRYRPAIASSSKSDDFSWRVSDLCDFSGNFVLNSLIIVDLLRGWKWFTARNTIFDANCRRYAAQIPALVVSVDYRLYSCPEPYDDGLSVLHWLDDGSLLPDLSTVFLAGNSTGGNIAHNLAKITLREILTAKDQPSGGESRWSLRGG